MTIANTVRYAFKAARDDGRSALVALLWAALDLRQDAVVAGYDAGLPPLLLADLSDLPGLMGRAEYACKTQWFDFLKTGAIGDLLWQMNHEAWRDWQ
jgi:hypothetical protein